MPSYSNFRRLQNFCNFSLRIYPLNITKFRNFNIFNKISFVCTKVVFRICLPCYARTHTYTRVNVSSYVIRLQTLATRYTFVRCLIPRRYSNLYAFLRSTNVCSKERYYTVTLHGRREESGRIITYKQNNSITLNISFGWI